MRTSTVSSAGVELVVRERGDRSAPTLIAVHGFPDTQAVWDPVAELLADDLHVVTYDTRGAGGSTAPAGRSGYAMPYLVDDLVAVMDATAPGSAVHLLGHDWGSVQLWGAVTAEATDPRLRGRLASFTSISGPALEHFAGFLRRSARTGQWRQLTQQLAHSWYIGAFCVPVLPELTFRVLGDRLRRGLERSQRLGDDGHWGSSFVSDATHGVNLYRANMGGGVAGPGGGRTDVPIQLVVPRFDAFLTPAIYDGLEQWVPNLNRVDVEAGHWVPRTDPELVADLVREFVGNNDGRAGA